MVIASIEEVDLQNLRKPVRDLQWVIEDLAGGKLEQPDAIARLQEVLDDFVLAAYALEAAE